MNKKELAEEISTQLGLSKKAAKEAVDAMFNTIRRTICDGDPVRISGFGTFEPQPRKATYRVNPRTRQRITVPAKAVPSFHASDELKDQLAKRLKVVESGGKLSVGRR